MSKPTLGAAILSRFARLKLKHVLRPFGAGLVLLGASTAWAQVPPTIQPVPAVWSTVIDRPTEAYQLQIAGDTPILSLHVTRSSSNPALVPEENIFFGFALGNYYLTVTPAFGQTGSADITVGVSDEFGSDSTTFTLNVAGPAAGAGRFATTSPITIPELGAADVYPSTVAVSGLPGTVTDVSLTLNGFVHDNVHDLNMLLVAPNGAAVLCYSKAGVDKATNITFTISDTALYPLPPAFAIWPEPLRPAAYGTADSFPTPAPAPPYGTTFAAFDGLNPNGTWSLYVLDGTSGAGGSIAGWSLLITTSAANTTISSIPNQTTSQNTPTHPISFTLSDPALPASDLIVTGSSDNATLLPDANIEIDGSGASRSVTLTPAADQVGTANVTLTVVNGSTFASQTFQLRVLDPSGDALPTISPIPSQTTLSGIPLGPLQISIGDNETPMDDLVLTGTSSDQTLVSDANITFYNHFGFTYVSVIPTEGKSGDAMITITVDDGIHTSSTTFTLQVLPLPAGTAQFSSHAAITISASGPATPYPSVIPVSGLVGTVADVTLTLNRLSHQWPDDLDILLVAPSGERVLVVSDAGGGNSLEHVTFALTDSAPFPLPDETPILPGTYKPANFFNALVNPDDILAPPAPAGPYSSVMSTFTGASPNGDWSLYIHDQQAPSQGSLEGGWTLTIKTIAPPVISDIADVLSPVNTTVGPISFTVEDADTAQEDLIVTANSDNQGLIPDANISINGTSGTRTLTLNPVHDQMGVATITVTASDGVNTDTEDFVVTVGVTVLSINIDSTARSYGDENPSFAANLTGVQAGDNITIGSVFSTATPSSPVGPYPIVASLLDPDNKLASYTVVTNGGTLTVAQRSLTLTAHGVNKTYDSTTAATVTFTDNRVSGDTITATAGAASFDTRSVGTAKPVSVTGISLSGPQAANYSFNTTASTTADITQRPLAVSATGVNKVYDRTTTAAVNFADDHLGSDVVTVSGTATFDNKNVGTGKAVSVTGISLAGADAGNYAPNTSTSTTADITQRALAVTATGVSKVYDGNAGATVNFLDDHLTGDTVVVSATATFANKSVGTGKAVSVTGIALSGADGGNYAPNTTTSTTADITKRPLTIGASAANKIYDGNTTAGVTLSDNRVAGDVFSASFATATFNNKHAGLAKPVSVTGIDVAGTDAGNYTFNTTASTAADISQRALTATAHGVDKVYDGNAVATVTFTDDRLGGDVFTVAGLAAFADKAVGVGKTVSVTGISLSGVDGGDYSVNATASTTASITKRALTITATGVDKAFDGNTTATVVLSDNRVPGDSLTTTYADAEFDDASVGTAKNITVTGIDVTGADAPNYTFNTTAATTAAITQGGLTVTASGVNKVYDGTTAATVTLSDNRNAGDNITVSYTTAVFDDKNAGIGKNVSVSGITVSGPDAGHYTTVNTTASTTANITQRALLVSATGVNKVYDRTTTAAVSLSDDRVTGDVVTATAGAAAFANKNVGTGKAISVTGITLSGADAGNYTFNATASAVANITARPLVVSATGVNKVYDGTTSATASLSDDHLAGDAVTASGAANFGTKAVGTGKTVSVTGITLSGADSGNYAPNTTAATTADITARALTISATGVDKVYDGTTTATVTLSDNRVSGDTLDTALGAAAFADKNVGSSRAISVTGITLSGVDSGNYTFNATASATANITARALVVSATGVNKAYDGSTVATVTISDNRVEGDVLTRSFATATFADANVGVGKSISVTGINVVGADAANYTFNTTATATADITVRALVITVSAANKVYDGTASATVTLSDDRVVGDALTVAFGSATFDNKNVGLNKEVSVTGITVAGTAVGNYSFTSTALATADVSQRALLITAEGVNRPYDGTIVVAVTLADDRVSGDVFTVTAAGATVADKHIGLAKAVLVTGLALAGADAGNYSFSSTVPTTVNITAAPLTVAAEDKTKLYGEANPELTLHYAGFAVGEDPSVLPTAPTPATTAGDSSPVGTYPITVGGGVGGDYALTYVSGTLTVKSAHAPSLTILGVAGAGAQLLVTADPGQSLIVEFTDDLITGDWTVLTVLENETGTNDVTDADSADRPHRFYRAKYNP